MRDSDSGCGHSILVKQRRVPFWKAILVALLGSLGVSAAAGMSVRGNDAGRHPDMMGTICRGSTAR